MISLTYEEFKNRYFVTDHSEAIAEIEKYHPVDAAKEIEEIIESEYKVYLERVRPLR